MCEKGQCQTPWTVWSSQGKITANFTARTKPKSISCETKPTKNQTSWNVHHYVDCYSLRNLTGARLKSKPRWPMTPDYVEAFLMASNQMKLWVTWNFFVKPDSLVDYMSWFIVFESWAISPTEVTWWVRVHNAGISSVHNHTLAF